MTIGVKLFAVVREAAGTPEVSLDLAEGATVADARDELLRRLPALSPYMGACAFAVNRTYATTAARLAEVRDRS